MRESLARKIELRSGPLQLIVGTLSRLAWAMENGKETEDILNEFLELADRYGHRYLDDAAGILQDVYNAVSGP